MTGFSSRYEELLIHFNYFSVPKQQTQIEPGKFICTWKKMFLKWLKLFILEKF